VSEHANEAINVFTVLLLELPTPAGLMAAATFDAACAVTFLPRVPMTARLARSAATRLSGGCCARTIAA